LKGLSTPGPSNQGIVSRKITGGQSAKVETSSKVPGGRRRTPHGGKKDVRGRKLERGEVEIAKLKGTTTFQTRGLESGSMGD